LGDDYKWEKPKAGLLKLNIDANLVRNNLYYLGVLVRNDEGTCLLGFSKIEEVDNIELAEAKAMLYGLNLCKLERIQIQKSSLN
jgi:hypothetical protein